MTVNELAKFLGVSKPTLYSKVKAAGKTMQDFYRINADGTAMLDEESLKQLRALIYPNRSNEQVKGSSKTVKSPVKELSDLTLRVNELSARVDALESKINEQQKTIDAQQIAIQALVINAQNQEGRVTQIERNERKPGFFQRVRLRLTSGGESESDQAKK